MQSNLNPTPQLFCRVCLLGSEAAIRFLLTLMRMISKQHQFTSSTTTKKHCQNYRQRFIAKKMFANFELHSTDFKSLTTPQELNEGGIFSYPAELFHAPVPPQGGRTSKPLVGPTGPGENHCSAKYYAHVEKSVCKPLCGCKAEESPSLRPVRSAPRSANIKPKLV
jgi:hypothetical protein